jgi:8-oxo-dGTP diphosphatase
MSFQRKPQTPYLCVDMILHTRKTEIILIERLFEPFGLALPGGFVDVGEEILAAAKRETLEETSCTTRFLEQFKAYGNPARDPRFHTCSVVYVGQVNESPKAADDAKAIILFEINKPIPQLQFDHTQILTDYLEQHYPTLKDKIL